MRLARGGDGVVQLAPLEAWLGLGLGLGPTPTLTPTLSLSLSLSLSLTLTVVEAEALLGQLRRLLLVARLELLDHRVELVLDLGRGARRT